MDREFLDSLFRGFKKSEEVANQTGENINDMLFSIGKEEKVQSIKELNDNGDIMQFACIPTSIHEIPEIPGSYKMKCDGCGIEVWMSPATKIVFDKVAKKLIMCIECLAKELDAIQKATNEEQL